MCGLAILTQGAVVQANIKRSILKSVLFFVFVLVMPAVIAYSLYMYSYFVWLSAHPQHDTLHVEQQTIRWLGIMVALGILEAVGVFWALILIFKKRTNL